MNIKDKLTIVIPSFNEENYIERTITNLASQNNITGTRVIIADGFSKDATRAKIINLKHNLKDILNIELVNGGKVAYARNFGLSLVKTKYVLFLDADTVLMDNDIIDHTLKTMYHDKLELLTCRVKSVGKDIRTDISFMLFNLINKLISRKTPFAVGTYFMTRTDKINLLNGFDETYQHSEDYMLSKLYHPKKFKISKKYIGQDDRRFKKMGYFGMVKLLINGYINRNNPNFFKHDVSYW
jgi:glycosyltransferase involved in cell wall biosynthesis